MAKTLRSILGESDAPRSKDEKQFYNMHKVEVIKNLSEPTKDDNLFNAKNIKTTSRKPDRHGYEPGEDLSQYDAGRATVPGTMKSVMGKQFAPTTTYESHTENQLKQASADHIRKARNLVDTKNINDPKVLRKFHQHDKAALVAYRLIGRLAGQNKGNTSQLRKEDTTAPTQSNLTDKVFKDENNSHTQTKKKQKPHVNYYDGGSAKQVARMVAKHRANEDQEIDEVSRDTLTSYVKKAISNAGKMASGQTDYNRNRPNATETPFDRPLKNREQGVKTAFKKAAGIAKVNMKEDVNEEYESDYHYHQDHFMDHNHRAVEANKLAKHYDLSADLGMKEDPERSAMHSGLSDAYKKIATQHLKMAAYHARKSGIKSR